MGVHCVDLLSQTLLRHQGIEKVELDPGLGLLLAVFNQQILSADLALQAIRESAQVAAQGAAWCAAERERGLPGCANCTDMLGKQLLASYQAAAALSTASIQNGRIEAKLDNAGSPAGHFPLPTVGFFDNIRSYTDHFPVRKNTLEIIFTLINALAGLTAWSAARLNLHPLVVSLLYVISFAFGSYFGLAASLRALKEKTINVDLLMLFAALGAAVIGAPAEGAMLLFLFSLSNTLQTLAMDRSRKAIAKLLDLRPSLATVRRGAHLVSVPSEQLALSEVVVIRPGERFPIDGEVLLGETDVDESTITGESIPVHKTRGAAVYASTLNGAGAVEIQVTRLTKDTTLARIVRMVEEAQSSKAVKQRALDRLENIYAVFVLAAAVLLILIPWLVLGRAFQPSFYRAMIWLVVASPCALVISTPASILSAIANAARNGVLFKGGLHLERTSTLKVVAFDKTGTLTTGKPVLAEIFTYENKMDETMLLALAAALESRSEHPLARAIVQTAQERAIPLPPVVDFKALPGQGVAGRVAGMEAWIGNQRMLNDHGVKIPADLLARAAQMEAGGQTVMFIYAAPAFLGLLAVADSLRAEAVEMIKGLKAAGIQRVVMLTGDNQCAASAIAARAGVDEFHAGLLPQEKVAVIKALRQRYGPVAMVGDGVNDAPSLAAADIGIAMGGRGTDVAIETADVVLMSDALNKIPFAIGLARRAERVVWQNLAFSMAVILVLVATALGARLPLPLGVLGHEGSTVLVVLNGLRLLGNGNIWQLPPRPSNLR